MPQRDHQRRLLLFFAAILIPALLLVALSLRMIQQERELAEKRLQEEQRRAVSAVRQELLARLEHLKLQELTALVAQAEQAKRSANPAVVLASVLEGEHLRLPWESARAAETPLTSDAAFAQLIQQGEQAELALRQPLRARAWYARALRRARQPAQTAYAQLLLARAYTKAGQANEAHALYQKLLAAPAELRDEQDIAFWLYAAEQWLLAGQTPGAVLQRMAATMSVAKADWRTRAPAEAYLRRGVLERLAAMPLEPTLRMQVDRLRQQAAFELQQMEQALALQNDLPSLLRLQTGRPTNANAEPRWLPYGANLWLVSLAPLPGTTRTAVLVVRARELFATLDAVGSAAGQAELLSGNTEQGEPLGASFPGLRVALAGRPEPALSKRWNLQLAFYVAALALVLSLTLFGAYLFWRDVRRELRLADLRSQFVSSVTHELKTPLTAIRMFAETLRLGRTVTPEAQAEYLDTIINESERLTRLINNVLDFSKIEQGRKAYQLAPLALSDVVRNATRALEYTLAQQGFALRVELDESLPPVNADSDALQQALLNLLINAMKYSGTSRTIALRLHRQDNWAVIEVEDWGLGIAPSEQTRIFEKFYRVQTPETNLIPGAGLGLTLVAHIAQAHDGHVTVQSTPGAGSTFALYLPHGVRTVASVLD